MTFVKRLPILMATLTAFAGAPASAAEESVNVYSYRQPTLIQPLLEAFSKNTGIKVNFIFAEKGLVERMVQEGRNSPADVLLTADVGRLVDATSRGLSSPLNEASINDNIPANLRDPDGNWFGLTMRARVAYVAKARVSDTSLSYEDLALPKWKGKVCLRSGQHAYNLGLIAAMIAHKGDAKTKEWLQGLRGNLIGKPNGNDRSQAKSVHAGECDVAIANTYYMGKMLTNAEEPEQQQWAQSVRIVFPSSSEMGTHVNISGMLLAKNAPNRANAVKLMSFLASPEAQQLYAEGNFEYPVNSHVQPSEIVRSWGNLVPDSLPVSEIAKQEKRASELVDEVGFDN